MKKLIIAVLAITTTAFSETSTYNTDERDIVIGGTNDFIQLSATNAFSYSAGLLSYDETSKTVLADTGFPGVRVNVGQESHIVFFNDTGSTISNGFVVSVDQLSVTNGIPLGTLLDSTDENSVLGFMGVCTADVLDGASGVATRFGEVRGLDTTAYSIGYIYASTNGLVVQTPPNYPSKRVIVGGVTKVDATDGKFFVSRDYLARKSASKSYSFTSDQLVAGTHWKAGFYDWSAADANLTQGATNVTHGTDGETYAAHASIVPSGAGTVDTGTVGLRVVGTIDSETGVQTAGGTGIITTNITTLSADTYYETSEKFSGDVSFELYVTSGSPTAYSLDFNYGFSKYEDFRNRDFTITGFEAVWIGNWPDSAFDVSLRHHKTTGWTYHATAFVAGNGDICRKSVDQAVDGNVADGINGAYKRVGLDTFIDGNASEGVLIEVITGTAKTIQTMDLHITALSEELLN